MACPSCSSEHVKKCGLGRKGQQKWQCLDCRKKWSDQAGPLGRTTTELPTAITLLSALLEGASVRSVERMFGVKRDTIIRIMVAAGRQCQAFMATAAYGHEFTDLQLDEQWAFVGCK